MQTQAEWPDPRRKKSMNQTNDILAQLARGAVLQGCQTGGN